jgi:uncharacterized protein
MSQLWAGPTTGFLEEVTQNRIAETLRNAWFEDRGFEPSPSELRSWRNSLRALGNAVRLAGLDDHGLLLEYQLPLSSLRIDAVLTGSDPPRSSSSSSSGTTPYPPRCPSASA